MNEINQGNVVLIEWMRLGSLGSKDPPVRMINRHNCHSKAILGIPERTRFITRLGVGTTTPRGPAAPPNIIPAETDPGDRPSTASRVVIRSIQVERRWIIGPAAPPHPAAPVKMGPRAQPTSLAYKRHLTLTGMDTQSRGISFPLFCSLRVGLV
jgi:hypothetical protein